LTQKQLERLNHTELNIAVEKMVFGRTPLVTLPRGYVCCPDYSGQWQGFGLVVERMHELGFKPDVRSLVQKLVDFGWTRMKVEDGRNRWSFAGPFIPRTAAIGAILAVEGS
jgi:hypothetical protein